MSNPVDLSVSPHHTPNMITDQMIVSLEKTRPHVQLVSYLGYFSSFIMFALALLVLIAMAVPSAGIATLRGSLIIGLVYLLGAVTYFIPSLFLSQYASQIGRLRESADRVPALESALDLQRSFWRFVGVVSALLLFLMLAGMVAAVAGAIFFASRF